MLFESERIHVTATFPAGAGTRIDGTAARGVAWLAVRVFEAGEAIPKEYDHARPVARVLERLPRNESHRSAMPSAFMPVDGKAHEVVIPRSVLTSIPPDTIVGIDWEFAPES